MKRREHWWFQRSLFDISQKEMSFDLSLLYICWWMVFQADHLKLLKVMTSTIFMLMWSQTKLPLLFTWQRSMQLALLQKAWDQTFNIIFFARQYLFLDQSVQEMWQSHSGLCSLSFADNGKENEEKHLAWRNNLILF